MHHYCHVRRQMLLVSIHKWPFSAISVSNCGFACAAYVQYASAQPLVFLDLAESALGGHISELETAQCAIHNKWMDTC